jgi:hypothetical protein
MYCQRESLLIGACRSRVGDPERRERSRREQGSLAKRERPEVELDWRNVQVRRDEASVVNEDGNR